MDTLTFFEKPARSADIVDIKDYDLVVIGAGSAGIPCAFKAAELGAKVALLQKSPVAMAQGNYGSGVKLEGTDLVDLQQLLNRLEEASNHRADRKQLEMWAFHSGEAISWLINLAEEAGAQVEDLGTGAQTVVTQSLGLKVEFVSSFFGPKPYTVGQGMQAICKLAEKKGVHIFYKTPALELVQDDKHCVKGVIAQGQEGLIQFNARKGVVVATGDYANDDAMMHHYLPDMDYIARKRFGYTGDGHKMIAWVGGRMENVGHTKMCHDMDAGPASMMNNPYLRVKMNGQRFCDESIGMELMNCYLNSQDDQGYYCQVFDANYQEQARKTGFPSESPDKLRNWMPEEECEHTGVMKGLIATYKADSLEELAEKLGIADLDTFKASVNRYNEICHTGKDLDFGTPQKNLCPVLQGPFYGIKRHIRFTIACSGMVVNDHMQVLDQENHPISGLYAAGNVAGRFFGGADYPLDVFGLNLGRNYTQGYVIAKEIMGKK